jgi:lysophospholipid acyltransferase (LPLAT)-like uncharacterized protein
MKIFKKIRSSSAVRWLASFFITQYVRLVWLTGRWQFLNKAYPDPYWQQNKPVIACFWHGRLLMMFKVWFGQHKLHMLISSHPDGQIIAQTTKNFGYGWIAGSSNREGRKAVVKILKTIKEGESVGVTPDGPRGPRYQVGLGVVQMARLSKASLLPVSYSATRGRFIKSWDRFFLPFPFSKGVVIYGPMIDVHDSSESDEELRQQLEDSLRHITQQADHLCEQGVTP